MDDVEALRQLIDERDRRYQQRFEASQEALKEALISINERLKTLNELRSGVATSGELQALEKLFNALATRVQQLESEKLGAGKLVTRVYAGIGAAVAVIGLIVLFANGVVG
jgi:predicted  nucleic acid-binding Zn-ribbon protein